MKTTGRVGSAALEDGASTLLYTVPFKPDGSTSTTDNFALCNVSVCNRGSSAAGVSIALVPSGANLSDEHWIEHNTLLLGRGVIERSAMTLTEGDRIYVKAAGPNLTAIVFAVFTGRPDPNYIVNGYFSQGLTSWTETGTDINIPAEGEVQLNSTGVANITQEIFLEPGTYVWRVDVKEITGLGNFRFFLEQGGTPLASQIISTPGETSNTVTITEEDRYTVRLEVDNKQVKLNEVLIIDQPPVD